MNVIEYDLSVLKPQKNNKSKSLKYIKHLHKIIKDLEAKLAESEEQLQDMERSKLAWENKYFKLEQQLAEKEKKLNILAFRISDLHEENLSFQIVEEENQQLKELWNKLKEYMQYRKTNFDKLLESDYASFEISGKRILIEELIYKMNKLEKGN